MLKDAILKVKILDRTEIDERLARSRVKLENDLIVTVPNSLIHLKEKVVIPKVIGDWIFKAQLIDRHSLRSALETATIRLYAKNGDEVIDWLKGTNNQDIFASAWANGYKVEKEKRYLVKMKGMDKDFTVLKVDKIRSSWYLGNDVEYSYTKTAHTRKQLEEAGFGDVFNSPLFEVEEVEG